jgi:hypothetical protein
MRPADQQPCEKAPISVIGGVRASALTMNVDRVRPLVVGPSVAGVHYECGLVPGVAQPARQGGVRWRCASAGCGVPERGLWRIPASLCRAFVFVDQATQDRSALDPFVVEVGDGVVWLWWT